MVVLTAFSYLPSELKIFMYRGMGAKIGQNVELGFGSFIIPFDNDFKRIHIENNVIIENRVQISSKKLFLGEYTRIKNNTKVSGQSDFTAGKRVYIDQECHFDLRRNIILGNNVVISGGCWFYTHMVFHSVLDGAPSKFGQIIIEEKAYLGANVFVLPDITIGNDAIIGARSVVTKNVNSDTVMVGNPAKEIDKTSHRTRKLTPEDKKIIVKDILMDFSYLYPETITLVKPWDKIEMIFSFQNHAILFQPQIDNFLIIDEKLKKFKKPNILISFNIPKKIKIECDKNMVYWIDLESRTKSSKKNKNSKALERFFENYGINII